MAFVAPTYAQSLQPGTEGYPGRDADLLTRINRPGWKVTSRAPSPQVAKDGTPIKDAEPHYAVTIAGPDGQTDQVIVDTSDHVVAGGEPTKAPDKPITPAAPHQTQAEIDQAAADAHAKENKPPAPGKTQAQIDQEAADQHAKDSKPAAPAKTQAQIDTEAADAHNHAGDAAALAKLQEANIGAQTRLGEARLAFDAAKEKFDQQVITDGQVTKAASDEFQRQHQLAQDAQAAADLAQRAVSDENTRQYQQGTLKNQSDQNTQTGVRDAATAKNQADTLAQTTQRDTDASAVSAATLLQRGEADKQASLDRQAQTGAGLLQQRGTEATSILGNWNSAMAGNKNFGLGGALPADFGANLTQGSIQQATAGLGGQSVMDSAAQAVHAANPALSGTPAGAGYTAVMQQMMDRAKPPLTTAPAAAGPTTAAVAAPAAAPATGASTAAALGNVNDPSDPAFLGRVIGSAISHLQGGWSATDPASQTPIPQEPAVGSPSFVAPGATA